MQKFNSYNELIQHARSELRYKGDGTYYELHHIIPRCLGGTDEKTNLVFLTLHEHVQAHYLLALENKDNSDIYQKMISSCIYIIHPKNYKAKNREEAIKSFLADKDMVAYYENIKIEWQSYRKEHKGDIWHFEHTWIQYRNQKPVSVAERRLKTELAKGAKIIEACPICNKENSRENFCCCDEHLKQFEEQRMYLQNKQKAEMSSNVWKTTDTAERRRKIGEANKIALKGKHWMNKDGVSKQFAPEDIEKALQEGWVKGRIMPNNPVLSRWNKG